jgi:hypothetical protein
LSGATLSIQSRRNGINRDVPEAQCNLMAAAAVTECKYEHALIGQRL